VARKRRYDIESDQMRGIRQVREQQMSDARRVIGRASRSNGWPADEARIVLESLGLRQPV
jgi:hypothetical protein